MWQCRCSPNLFLTLDFLDEDLGEDSKSQNKLTSYFSKNFIEQTLGKMKFCKGLFEAKLPKIHGLAYTGPWTQRRAGYACSGPSRGSWTHPRLIHNFFVVVKSDIIRIVLSQLEPTV